MLSDDPEEVVNGIALGPTVLKILVQIPIKPDMFLFRPATNMSFIKEARGKAIAWPAERVIQQFSEESEEEQIIISHLRKDFFSQFMFRMYNYFS